MSVVSKRISAGLVAVFFCLFGVLGSTTPCFAADDGATTVKVGYFEFDGYHMLDDDGLRSGYGYEMLQHLAGYAGLNYEYVGYEKSWSEMQDMLENGEIDLLTSVQKTPDREARFDFSTSDIGVSSAVLSVKAGDRSFANSDYANWNGIRIGMLQNNSRNDHLAQFAEEHGFSYESVFFANADEMTAELQSNSADKRIDAILTSSLRKSENEWTLAQFDASPFYIMVRKGNDELLDRINNAITQLDLYEPGLQTELMSKYYSEDNSRVVAFTSEESAYIDSMQGKALTAIINPDRAPYSWYENGSYHGVLYDIAQVIIARSGLSVEFVEAKDRATYLQLIDDKAVDLRFDMTSTYNRAEQDDFWLTSAYMTVPVARLYREDTSQFETAAMPINNSTTKTFNDEVDERGFELTTYNSVAETAKAVLDGKQDMAYLAKDTARMVVRDDLTNRLVAEEIIGQDVSCCVAVSYSQNPLLFSILTKSVSSLSTAEIDTIRQGYSDDYEKPFSLIGFFYDYPIHVFSIAVIILVAVIVIIILAAKVRRRKSEHRHLKLEQQQNMLLKDALSSAEKAGAAKSQFLSHVSHEMRTPLNAIIGFINLAKGADKEQMDAYLVSSNLAAKQLSSIINDVLDMSSIESGKLKIANAPFNFRHLISSITTIYGTQCMQKGVAFDVNICTPTEDWVIGDELRFNQILMNLLDNAVKFTSEGHIWLTISETASDEDKVFMRFLVSDTGCGMSEEMLGRLFTPFEQESTGTAKKYGGSGLGLSIVKNLVEMMGGKIKVESAQDKGTTFTIDLPFGRSTTDQQTTLPDKVKTVRVLVVDDLETERDYMSTVLDRIGVRSTCVLSGQDALAELDQAEQAGDGYNICLIDWKMPDMDGMDTTSRIREKYGEDVIIIIVSAYDFQQVSESAMEAGANLFLSKPIFQSTLFDLLVTLTEGEAAKTEEKPNTWDFTGKRVLLAEDNALNQIVAKGYLDSFNVTVDLAEDGQIVVDKFLASEPGFYDAILMDIQMPNMDGFEATKIIRESDHPDATTIQIIAQTADAFSEDISKVLSANMNAHISKPIYPELLAKALHKAFELNTKE